MIRKDKHRPRHSLLGLAAGFLLSGLVGAGIGVATLLSGAYDTSATRQHFALTHWILETGLRFSVAAAADEIVLPPLDNRQMLDRGLVCFVENCAECHGAPGLPPGDAALGMLPVPTSLAQAARDWSPAELYWLVSKGIRMTGMPAWEYRLSQESRWAVVAFLRVMPSLSRAGYTSLVTQVATAACDDESSEHDLAPADDGDDDPRRTVIRQYACHACHRITGVVGPAVDVGPPLDDWSRQRYIAGVLPNTPANLVRWLQDPDGVSPGTLMPDLDVADEHAAQIASFLFGPDSP